jgi:uncharacterized membrane protein YdjX (TVP38/TMEM64 family)
MVLAGFAAALLVWWLARGAAPRVVMLITSVQKYGAAAPLAFIVAYAVAVMGLVPGSPMTLIGGAMFGFLPGALYSFAGATLGATAAFQIGRSLLRRPIESRLASRPRLAAMVQAVSADGRRIVFLLRLSPVVPFNVLNYVLGLTTISLGDFVLASVGMAPGTFAYAYGGKLAGEALALAGQARLPHDTSYYVVLLAGLVATIAVTFILTRTAQRALRRV